LDLTFFSDLPCQSFLSHSCFIELCVLRDEFFLCRQKVSGRLDRSK
jgi:hypothetical protein